MEINFKNLPYDHSGRWHNKFQSVLNPVAKITWPQLLSEYVVIWKKRLLKSHSHIKVGPGWYKSISADVRKINQQATVICNYFPHPDDEPLVICSFQDYFRKNRVLTIGSFRKNRIVKEGNREILNITKAERDVVLGINAILQRLIEQRLKISKIIQEKSVDHKGDIKYRTGFDNSKSISRLEQLAKIEEGLTNGESR